MRNRLLLLVLLALPACAGTNAHPPQTTATLAGPVTYEVRSWGRIQLRWQIDPDGTGEIWRGAGLKDPAEIRKFHLHLQGRALQSFAAEIEKLRMATRDGIACKKTIFDLPYGAVTWDYPGAKQVYSFDAGCRSGAGDAAMDLLKQANSMVENMASIDAEPYITEPAGNR